MADHHPKHHRQQHHSHHLSHQTYCGSDDDHSVCETASKGRGHHQHHGHHAHGHRQEKLHHQQSDKDHNHDCDRHRHHHDKHNTAPQEAHSRASANSSNPSISSSDSSSSFSSSSSSTSSCSSSSTSSSSTTSSSSSTSSGSSSTWSSETSLENAAFTSEPKQKVKHPQHTQSCTDISWKKRAFEDDEDEEDSIPLLGEDDRLYKSSSLERNMAAKQNVDATPRKATSSKQLQTNTLLKIKQEQTKTAGGTQNIRKAKSMEALSSQREKIDHTKLNAKDLEKMREEAKKNFVREKVKFSAFLNEITRQVLSPSRLTSLGVTGVQRPSSPSQVSLKSPRLERQVEEKQKHTGSRPNSPSSVASSVHSHTSKYSRSSKQSHSNKSSHSGCHHSHKQHHHQEAQDAPKHHHDRASCHTGPHTGTDSLKNHALETHHGHKGHKKRHSGSKTHLIDGTSTDPELSSNSQKHRHSRSPTLHHHQHRRHSPSPSHHQHHHGAHHSPNPHHHSHHHHSQQESKPNSHHLESHQHPSSNSDPHHHSSNPEFPEHHSLSDSQDHHSSHPDKHHHSSQRESHNLHSPSESHYHHSDMYHHDPSHSGHEHHHPHHGSHHHPTHLDDHHHPSHPTKHPVNPTDHESHHHHHSDTQPHSHPHSPSEGSHHHLSHSDHHHHQHSHSGASHPQSSSHPLSPHHSHYHHSETPQSHPRSHSEEQYQLQHTQPRSNQNHSHSHPHPPTESQHNSHSDSHNSHPASHHHSLPDSRHHSHPDIHHHSHHSSHHHPQKESIHCHSEHRHHDPVNHHHSSRETQPHHSHGESHHLSHSDSHSHHHQHHEDPGSPHCHSSVQPSSSHLAEGPESCSGTSHSSGNTPSSTINDDHSTLDYRSNSSTPKDKGSELERIRILQVQNEDLHHSLLQTAVRMECMGAEFKSGHQLLESELQRTRLELSALVEKFKRLHNDYSSTQTTNHLLEEKLHNVAQNMDEERGRLNNQISELTEQLAAAKTTIHGLKTINVGSVLQEVFEKHFHPDDRVNQFMLPVAAPPPAQFMDTDHYGKGCVTGDDQSLDPLPEEEESDWSEVGEDTTHSVLRGSDRGRHFSPWRQSRWVSADQCGKGDGDTESESGNEELVRQDRPLQIPHLQFTLYTETFPALDDDASYNESVDRGAVVRRLGSPVRLLSASLEEIHSSCMQQPEEQHGQLKCTDAMMDLHHTETDSTMGCWKANSQGCGGDGGAVLESTGSLASLESAQKILNHFIQSRDGEGQDIGEVHEWMGGVAHEVLNGERTKL